jgi:hypothetical protein
MGFQVPKGHSGGIANSFAGNGRFVQCPDPLAFLDVLTPRPETGDRVFKGLNCLDKYRGKIDKLGRKGPNNDAAPA